MASLIGGCASLADVSADREHFGPIAVGQVFTTLQPCVVVDTSRPWWDPAPTEPDLTIYLQPDDESLKSQPGFWARTKASLPVGSRLRLSRVLLKSGFDDTHPQYRFELLDGSLRGREALGNELVDGVPGEIWRHVANPKYLQPVDEPRRGPPVE